MLARAGDVYTVYNEKYGVWTACQITAVVPADHLSSDDQAVVLTYDWVGDRALEPGQLDKLQALYYDFYYWKRELCLLNVPVQVPGDYILVGQVKPLEHERCKSYGFWDRGYYACRQHLWRQIPDEQRKSFKAAMSDTGVIELNGCQVQAATRRVNDEVESFESALELRALPCVYSLECHRWHPDLIEFLQSNPFITQLTLINHGQRTLDLRGTAITSLMLDMNGLEQLWTGERTEELQFQQKEEDHCTVHAHDSGARLQLSFIARCRPHPELSALQSLHGSHIDDFDIAALPEVYPELKELRLWGAPGRLRGMDSLHRLKALQRFSTYDLFGFGADDVPRPDSCTELNWLWMTSLPADAAREVKKLWKGRSDVDLKITQPRKEEWLAQNLDNPLRSWDGCEHIPARAAQKAARQYRKTRSELIKLAASAADVRGADDEQEQIRELTNKALAAVSVYTETFNRMDFIETEQREEVYMALKEILNSMAQGGLDRDALLEHFEQLRDF